MGREVRDSSNPDGEIEIRYTGLRPGEKLFEELRIDDCTTPTEHPRIRRTTEPFLEKAELDRELSTLEDAMASERLDVIQAVLARTVEGYQPNTLLPGDGRGRAWRTASRMLH
jgi:FlaA1/EpsC-like NDP-sugar epimerase